LFSTTLNWFTASQRFYRVVEVDHPCLRAADVAPDIAVLDGDAIHEQAMQHPVLMDQIRSLGSSELAESILQRLGGKLRVEPGQGVTQPLHQDDLPVVGTLGHGLPGPSPHRF
jgi:hypothetical protein